MGIERGFARDGQTLLSATNIGNDNVAPRLVIISKSNYETHHERRVINYKYNLEIREGIKGHEG